MGHGASKDPAQPHKGTEHATKSGTNISGKGEEKNIPPPPSGVDISAKGESISTSTPDLGEDDIDDESHLLNEMAEVGVPAVPDGGYGWVIVFASFLCNAVVDGMANSYGVFLPYYAIAFKASKGNMAWGGSLLCGVYMLVGPIVSALTNKFGCRAVTIAGTFVAAAGFGFSALCTSLPTFLLTFGVIGGIGFGLIYLPAVVVVGYYFEKKRAFATGIAVCGSGVGTFVFAPLASALLGDLGMSWEYTNLIFAGIILLCGIAGLLMKPLVVQVIDYEEEDDEDRMGDLSLDDTGYFTVQLPDGRMERRPKLPVTSEPGVPSTANVDNLASPTPIPAGGEDTKSIGAMVPRKLSFRAVPLAFIGGSRSRTNLQDRRRSSVKSSDPSFSTSRTRINSASGISGGGGPEDDFNSMTDGFSAPPAKARTSDPQYIIRPMSRKDIFFAGSIGNVENRKSLQAHRKSAATLESATETEGLETTTVPKRKRCPCCRCPEPCCPRCPCCRRCRGYSLPGPGAFKSALKQMLDFSLLKNPIFLFIGAANVFAMLGFYVPFVYLVDAAIGSKIDPREAALLLSFIGVTNTIGRVVAGLLVSLCPRINSLVLHNMCILGSGVTIVCAPWCRDYYSYVLVALFFGLFVAGFVSLTSIILVDLLGLDKLTNAFGLLILFRGGAALVGAPMAGALYDHYESYEAPFWVAGGFLIIAATIAFMIPFIKKFGPKTKKAPKPRPMYNVKYLEDGAPSTKSSAHKVKDAKVTDETKEKAKK